VGLRVVRVGTAGCLWEKGSLGEERITDVWGSLKEGVGRLKGKKTSEKRVDMMI